MVNKRAVLLAGKGGLAEVRIGLCTIAFRDWKLERVLDLARKIGYEGVELWGREPHICESFDAERVAAARSEVLARGLQIASYSPYVYLSSVEEHEAEEELQKALDLLRIARALGSPRMRVYAGRRGSRDATARDWESCIGGLRALADAAAAAGVTLCVETHGGTLADTTETTARLLSTVNSTRLRVLFDPVNLWPEDPVASARALQPHTELVHLKNKRDKDGALPLLDEGPVDFTPTLRSLAESGYHGFIDVEFVNEANREAAAAHDYAFLERVIRPTRP